jgi:hypothetical protein
MKKIMISTVALVLYGWTWGLIGSDAASLAAEPYASSENTITLFENTTLYDDFRKPLGNLSPQTVKILDSKQVRTGHGEGYYVPMYLIPSWIGKVWIMPFNALLGEQIPMDKNLALLRVEPLYSDPGLTGPTGIQLAPQTVKVKAKWENRYLIETMNGERWIAPRHPSLLGVKEAHQEVQLQHTTKLYSYPNNPETWSELSPQTVMVNQVWRDWQQTQTWSGPMWFKLHDLDASDAEGQIEIGLSVVNCLPLNEKLN